MDFVHALVPYQGPAFLLPSGVLGACLQMSLEFACEVFRIFPIYGELTDSGGETSQSHGKDPLPGDPLFQVLEIL